MCVSVKTCGLPQIEASQMSNLTVKPGEKVVFNCKVDFQYFSIKETKKNSRLTFPAWSPLSGGIMRWRMGRRY